MPEADSTASVQDAEQIVADAETKGYLGETPDYDRDAFTLKTGPDSPSSLESTLQAKRAEIDAQLDEYRERGAARVSQARENAPERVEQAQARVEQEKPHAQERQAERQSARHTRRES